MLLAHAVATLIMVGVIWIVQLVHYPSFTMIEKERFVAFSAFHQRRISRVVIVPMLVEMATAGWLLAARPDSVTRAELWIGTALLAVIWLSTVLLQIPAHRQLTVGYDADTIASLVRGNWIRTLAWTARGALVVLWLWR